MPENLEPKPRNLIQPEEGPALERDIRTIDDLETRAQERSLTVTSSFGRLHDSFKLVSHQRALESHLIESELVASRTAEETALARESFIRERLSGYPEGVKRVLSLFKSLNLEELERAVEESRQKKAESEKKRWDYTKEDSRISEEFTIEAFRILNSQIEGVLNDYQIFYENINEIIETKYLEEFKDLNISEFYWLKKDSMASNFTFGIRMLVGSLATSKIQEIIDISRSNGVPEEVIKRVEGGLRDKRQYYNNSQGKSHVAESGIKMDEVYQFEQLRVAINFLRTKEDLKMLFGESLGNLQQSIYTNSLESSLFLRQDSRDNFRLREFFTPESLRVLIIHATSSQRNSENSKKVLGGIEGIKIYMQNPNWSTLLDETLNKYPELECFRGVLEGGNFESLSLGNVELTPAYIESILNLYRDRIKDNPDNLIYRNLLDSIPSEYLLNELVKNNKIDEGLAAELGKLLESLKETRNEGSSNNNDSKIRTYLINEIYNFIDNPEYEFDIKMFENLSFLKDFLDRKYRYSDEGIVERVLNKGYHYSPKGIEFLNLLKVIDGVENSLKESDGQINQENWNYYLITYIAVQNRASYSFIDNETVVKTNSIFADKESANLCLQQMLLLWKEYLQQEDKSVLPAELQQISSIINESTELGPYSQLKSIGIFLSKYDSFSKNENTSEEVRANISALFEIFETKLLDSKKISNETRINFYTLMGDLLSSNPKILEAILPLIKKLEDDNKELLKFTELVLPKIHLMNLIFKGFSLERLNSIISEGQNVDQVVEGIELIIRENFETHLGIKKVPENLDEEVLRKLNGVLTYMSFINGRDSTKETILSFFASQIINGNWQSFRSGEPLDAKEYVGESRVAVMETILEKRRELTRRIFEGFPLSEDQIKEIIHLLQDETQNIAVTNVETVDLKLQNIVSSVENFIDLDLFPEGLDKSRLLLLRKFDPKLIGACVSKLYRLSSNESEITKLSFSEFKDEEKQVLESIQAIFDEYKIEFNQTNIKLYFQDGLKLLSNIVSLEKFINDSEIPNKVQEMRSSLLPDQELISIFQRVGEGFTPISGAYALSSDLNYLKGLVQRHEKDFTEEERKKVETYLNTILDRMKNLEEIHKKIIERLVKITESPNYENNIQLKNLVGEAIRMANRNNNSNEVSTLLTNDLNVIIENIRACLSCRSAECNNDTNLSFGDFNKFFLSTSMEGKGISDQIVYFLPVTRLDGKRELSFVIDTAYGDSGISIMVNHLETVMKKVRQIKSKFPDLEISIVLPAKYNFSKDVVDSMTNRGYQIESESVKTDLVQSALSLHYPEFGPIGRTVGGEFKFNCFIIKG